MEFTTHFELHSQATRLDGSGPDARRQGHDGTGTLCGPPFNGSYPCHLARLHPSRLQFRQRERQADFKFELFPVHSPLLGESLLVSFPPLNNMLKFSGSSCLISGRYCDGCCRRAGVEDRPRQTCRRARFVKSARLVRQKQHRFDLGPHSAM